MRDEPASAAGEGDGRPLRRVLGPFDATMLVMGCIVGAGIFKTPSHVAEGVASPLGILALWIAGGLVSLCGAFVFAELAAVLPRTGGQYVFLREAFGRTVAFLFGWMLLAAINAGAIAYVARVFVEHVITLVGAVRPDLAPGDGTVRVGAMLLIAGLTALNVRGVRLGADVQNVAMLAKIAGLLLVVGLGAWAFGRGLEPAAPAPRAAAAGAGAGGWAGFATALLSVVFSYGGWQNVAAVASEVREPERNLPRAILLGTALVIALYVGLNASLLAILGPEGVAATPTPAATAAGALLPGGELVVAGLVVLSTFAIAQALLMVAPRIYFAMARDGLFLRAAGRVHPRHGTPAVAIALLGAVSIAHLFYGSALDLLTVTTVADWTFFGLCGVALFVLRRREPARERPYRAFGHPWVPGAFVVVSFVIALYGLVHAERLALVRAAVLVGAGLVLLARWSRAARSAVPPPSGTLDP